MSCSRTQRSDASEARTRNPFISSQALCHYAPQEQSDPCLHRLSISTFVNSLERLLAKLIKSVNILASLCSRANLWLEAYSVDPPPSPKTCFLAIQRFKTSSFVSTSTTTPNFERNMGPDVRNTVFRGCSQIKFKSAWPRGYQTFSGSTQLSKKLILLINVEMPIIVDMFTFISRINTAYERFKARKIFIFHHFTF